VHGKGSGSAVVLARIMKLTILTQIFGVAVFAVLAMPAQMIAQKKQEHKREPFPHYKVIDLGTLGGTFSQDLGINNKGHVGGAATLSNGTTHAFLWTKHTGMKDLGTLGGPNSAGHRLNDRDEVPVVSDTSTPDPLGEDFCGFGTHLICLGSIWKNGVITPLRTLGGNNAQAHTANNRGQVAGSAENNTHDPSCALATPSQVLDYEAVRWEPNGEIHELRPLQGDSVGFAYSINGRGQVVGSSGTCANTPLLPIGLGPHAVLWESDGSPTDLGSLGGQKINTATTINDRGEVAGVSNLRGDTATHTFLWTKERGIKDLGTVGADVSSTPAAKKAINNKGQVVGASCSTANPFEGLFSGKCRAYLWQDNVMEDLNVLVPANSNPDQLQLFLAFGINDAGEIAGWAVEKSTGDVHAFLATPCHRHDEGRECCEDDDR
jgi:probable HAF family extracellular repeat protein